MNEITEINVKKIKSLIHEIRGQRVILDSDIAILFRYETKNLNRQVMRNKNRFSENYCFRLTMKNTKT